MNNTNIFVIRNNKDDKIKITYEMYLLKLMRKMKNFNEIIIQAQIGCQDMTNSLIEDIIGVGEWTKEYEKRTKILKINKEKNEKYQLEIYEFCVRRGVHNQIKNV